MSTWLKRIGIFLVIVFLAIQVYRPSRTNAPEDPFKTIAADAAVGVPPAAFQRACMDCHSNQTVWPWYSAVAPVSWLVADDVRHGRSHLNVSEWGALDAKKKDKVLEEICEEIEKGAMPLKSYRWMHSDARLSPDDVKAICGWTQQARQRLAAAAASASAAAQESNSKQTEDHSGHKH